MAAADVIVTRALAWVLVLLFALVLGGQAFDTFVLVPIWSAHPPDSVDRWRDTPAAGRVPRYFMRLLLPLLAISLVAAAWALFTHATGRGWLLLAAACGITHLALVRIVFVPTNQALGFLPSQSADAPPEKVRLVSAWVRWNSVRLMIDFVGLLASVKAIS
jgi:uncharacterized membrane protein